MSHLLDKSDRSTVVLFGDGASCMILSRTEENVGFLAQDFGTDGTGCDLLYVNGGVGNKEPVKICMNGREVFVRAVKSMTQSLKNSIKKAGLTVNDIDLIIPHQANIRIIECIEEKLGVDPKKVAKTLHKQGNTSAASIPLAMYTVWKSGGLENVKTVAFCGFGVG